MQLQEAAGDNVVWKISGRLKTTHVQSNSFQVYMDVKTKPSVLSRVWSAPECDCGDLTHSNEPHSQSWIQTDSYCMLNHPK